MPLTLYRYDVKTPAGKWWRIRWAMTEEDAADYEKRNRAELRQVEGSREERPGLNGGLMPSLTGRDSPGDPPATS